MLLTLVLADISIELVELVWFGRKVGLRDAMEIVLLREEERERDSCSSIRWSIEPDRSIY